jgi:hypothetical protein
MAAPFFPRDEYFMRLAIREAQAALDHEDIPVGAVVVRDGEVIGAGHNERELRQDPTAHAELLALREASRAVGSWRVLDAVLYVTLDVRRRDRARARAARRLRGDRSEGGRRRLGARHLGPAAAQPPAGGRGRAAGGGVRGDADRFLRVAPVMATVAPSDRSSIATRPATGPAPLSNVSLRPRSIADGRARQPKTPA